MKIKKLNESSLVDKKVSTLGKAGKPMYFTADQLKDAKEKYPEYDFEETAIDKSLPQGQKAYIAKKKVEEAKQVRVFGAKAKKLNESAPSQETLDDCLQDYKENAFGFDGVEDYVETNYPAHPQDFKDAIVKYLRGNNESLVESFDEVSDYTLKFSVYPKFSGNSTKSDDILRRAEECGCVRFYLPSSQGGTRFYACKSQEQFDAFMNSFNECLWAPEYRVIGPVDLNWEDIKKRSNSIYLDRYDESQSKSIKLNESADYKVKFFQVFEAPKSPKENGKMIGQRGTLDAANAFGKEKVGAGNYIIKAVCDDGQTRPIDNDTKLDAFKMVNEAHYGGAFDIADNQYFTKDDLMSFADEVLGHVSETFNGLYDIGGVWFENGNVITQIVDSEGNEFEDTTHVDMRRIREPWHLKRMYAFPVAANIIKQIQENDANVMNENVMGMGKYSDKFHQYLMYLLDEGKEDNLKYLALQLIRYCKEEDLKDLWLDRMEKVAKDDGFGVEVSEALNSGCKHVNSLVAGDVIEDNDVKMTVKSINKKPDCIEVIFDDGTSACYDHKEEVKVITEALDDEALMAQRYVDVEIPELCEKVVSHIPNMREGILKALNHHCLSWHSAVESLLDRSGYYKYNESLNEDVEVPTLEGPKAGPESGLASLINEALQDELKTIQMYNDTALTARAEGFDDIASQIDEINTEENKHVGQLQELLKTISPNAEAIDAGELEAGDSLVNISEEINNSEENGNNNDIKDSTEKETNVMIEAKERWEQIYNSFKAIEKELDGDGEAITAAVDRLYNDNKDDPDYKKAYDRWGSGE